MNKIYVYTMYGLGGPVWSGGMESNFDALVRKLVSGVTCPEARHFGSWRSIVEDIKKLPAGSKVVVAGHSMGAGSATYVTDYVYVDLVILFDCAGQKPSRIGKNTGKCIDIWDHGFDPNPNFRVQPVNDEYAKKIEHWDTYFGHTAQDDDPLLAKRAIAEINKLA